MARGKPGKKLKDRRLLVLRQVFAGLQARMLAAQRPGSPLLSPLPPTADQPAATVGNAALYAGESALRMGDVRPAAELVAELTP